MRKSYSAYFIGDDNLVIECAERWLKHHHIIKGIISQNPLATVFAKEHSIHLFESVQEATPFILEDCFDYLFSIINGFILPEFFLNKPKCLSINYHNAKLPKYAGLHASSWAILNQEKRHGVTWHIMTSMTDAGDILIQDEITIAPHETGLSLSIKCYQLALSTFEKLIINIEKNQLIKLPQDLTQRTYHNFYEKPLGNGLLFWNTDGEIIEKTYRALQLGEHYHNRLCITKILIKERLYLINKMNLTGNKSIHCPGTIVSINKNNFIIATTSQDILVNLLNINSNGTKGSTIPINSLGLDVGSQLEIPNTDFIARYTNLSYLAAKSELFWVKELEQFVPANLPFFEDDSSLNISEIGHFKSIYQIDYSSVFIPDNKSVYSALAALLIYLYRMGNQHHLGIGLTFSELKTTFNILEPFFSSVLPFCLTLDDDFIVHDLLTLIEDKVHLLMDKKTFACDVFCRYPELSTSFNKNAIIEVLIENDQQITPQASSCSAPIIFCINIKKNIISCYANNHLFKKYAFWAQIIENSKNHLNELLNQITLDATKKITQLNLLNPKDKKTLINDWNKDSLYSQDKEHLITLFKKQAIRYGNNIALKYNEQTINYTTLDQKSNQYALFLITKGLHFGDFCALCKCEGFDFFISVLAIIKVGAAYIPLDTSYPDSHIQYILVDSNASLIICSESERNKLERCNSINKKTIISYDELKEKSLLCNSELPHINLSPETLAYVIYTSGTTGKPKGVMIPHRGVVRLVNKPNYIKINTKDVIAQAASISFDAATFEIWGSFLNAATLCLVPYETLLNIEQFDKFLSGNSISILFLTTGLFNQYAAQNPSLFKALNYLIVGGDIMNKERMLNVFSNIEGRPNHFLHAYGPTENTTFTTTHSIIESDFLLPNIPIGKAITNTTLYVLDKYMQPVPIGALGELYIGGQGIAIGYRNKPELTQFKFIKDPFINKKNALLYKTGDMVRWMPDGGLDFKERQDSQIKIRGFRVELDAIHSHLLTHSLIHDCYIKTYQDAKHNKMIVAYYVAKEKISDVSLHHFLKSHLPEYMIPSIFVHMHHLPLNINGKVNATKLPAPDLSQKVLSSTYKSPKSAIEKKITSIWSELFHIKPIGIHDSFFELGGDSLLVTHLSLKIKKKLDFDLILHDFLENPTIAHIAQLIEHEHVTTTKEINSYLQQDTEFSLSSLSLNLEQIKNSPKHLLLTGATGFLGAHLLYDLFHKTNAVIYCLIRADTLAIAKQKLNATLMNYQLDLLCNKRIIPLIGDLSKPQLGLSAHNFNRLSNELDAIYHNGAFVHHLYHYNVLRDANVLSTIEILKLATTKKLKRIHFISTLSAASNFLSESSAILEEMIPHDTLSIAPSDGYSQTKWAAEKILDRASKQNIPINTYRPGWILGHSKTGIIAAEKNHLLNLINGCIQMKAAPNWTVDLDILPVDFISNAITSISLENYSSQNTFNMLNTNAISWINLISYLKERGYEIEVVSSIKWKNNYLAKIDRNNALFPLLTLYLNFSDSDWMKKLSSIKNAHNEHVMSAYKRTHNIPPFINKNLLDTYFSYLEQKHPF